MGQQALRRLIPINEYETINEENCFKSKLSISVKKLIKSKSPQISQTQFNNFVDLYLLPPELALQILRNLNATDLCLASCVWSDLASDEFLWQKLCKSSWGYCSAYKQWKRSYKKLYLLLDEGCLTFNNKPEWGVKYLIDNNVLENEDCKIAKFFHSTNRLCWQQVRNYLNTRKGVLDEFIKLQNFKKQFLPNALRKFFNAIQAPTLSDQENLQILIEKFSRLYCEDNPEIKFKSETVAMLCYALILLSVDLTSPHVKNKMSKREFVKNICQATHQLEQIRFNNLPPWQQVRLQLSAKVSRDFAGHLYDNVYLCGHVAPQRWENY